MMVYSGKKVSKRKGYYHPKKREVIPVTVCVAAICEGDIIIGASDRMLTSGDIQFEPPLQKIWKITDSIAVMTAGDSPIQTVILENILNNVYPRYEDGEIISVKEVADLYSHYHSEEQSKEAARKHLKPFGLTLDSFMARQQEFSSDFVKQVGNNIVGYALPDVEAIVTGVDESGANLYQVFNGEVTCQNAVGFVAIGAGGWHANSQFMFAGHTRYQDLPETLFLTYSAKKRAEVAPGVGSDTDMFFIGPRIGTYIQIGMGLISRLEKIYQDVITTEAETRNRAVTEVQEYVQENARKRAEARATAEAQNALTGGDGGHQSDDQKTLRDGADESEPQDESAIH